MRGRFAHGPISILAFAQLSRRARVSFRTFDAFAQTMNSAALTKAVEASNLPDEDSRLSAAHSTSEVP